MAFPRRDIDEVGDILDRTLDVLLQSTAGATSGRAGSQLRRAVGDLRSNLGPLLRSGEFTATLLTCFVTARTVGINLTWMDNLIDGLFAEVPASVLAAGVVQVSIVFALSQEAQIIADTKFTSRNDIDALMARMKTRFDAAKEIAADAMDSACYAALISLAASVVQHLVKTARPLPRMVNFMLNASFPSLTVSQRIYGDGSHSEELLLENKIVHPAFCLPNLRALSA